MQESKQEVTKVVSFVKADGKKIQSLFIPLKHLFITIFIPQL